MQETLKTILAIQELDMKMIRLMRLKNERKRELDDIYVLREKLNGQKNSKEQEIKEIKKDIRVFECQMLESKEKLKKLESRQGSIKKLEEFNALSHEINTVERERSNLEQKINALGDKLDKEEIVLEEHNETLKEYINSSKELEEEILESIKNINEEGKGIKSSRDILVEKADPDAFRTYERLLQNRRDRVVVPIEERSCSGCHIMLTAQHENLVRKGEKLIFCEHCSRIHYWQDSKVIEGSILATKTRRRRTKT